MAESINRQPTRAHPCLNLNLLVGGDEAAARCLTQSQIAIASTRFMNEVEVVVEVGPCLLSGSSGADPQSGFVDNRPPHLYEGFV